MQAQELRREFADLLPDYRKAVRREARAKVGSPAYERASAEVAAYNDHMLEVGLGVRVDGSMDAVFALKDIVVELEDLGRPGGLSENSDYAHEVILAKLLRALNELEKQQQ